MFEFAAPSSAFVHGPSARTRAGVGFKPQHFDALMEGTAAVGFIEVHAENYMGAGGVPHHHLTKLRERYSVSIHGVGLSIGGDVLDEEHLSRLQSLVARYEPEWVSEHLAWSSHGGVFFNDLLPLAYDNSALARVVRHMERVQEKLRREVLLENPATYVSFAESSWDEADFIREVSRRSGCGILLDVNNVQVSCVNHGRDPIAYLESLPLHRVGEIHLAGYAPESDSLHNPLLIDAHDRIVQPDVWKLYERLLDLCGPSPTLIEWDNDVPDAETLFAEAGKAARRLAKVSARWTAA
ncbi:MAG: DUF692 family multinuclear iron-containing protein [Beijerinckiaceae bacterium]